MAFYRQRGRFRCVATIGAPEGTDVDEGCRPPIADVKPVRCFYVQAFSFSCTKGLLSKVSPVRQSLVRFWRIEPEYATSKAKL